MSITVLHEDAAGNMAQWGPATVTKDVTSPTLVGNLETPIAGTYDGSNLDFVVTYSEPMKVTQGSGGWPRLTLTNFGEDGCR